MRALIAILLGGCADDDPSDSESSGSPGGDSGASWFDASAPAAEYSLAEVEAAITQAPQDSVLVPLDTFVWISSVVDRFSVEGNPACPAWLASESNPSASYSNWLGTCDAGDELLRGSWGISVSHTSPGGGATQLMTRENFSFVAENTEGVTRTVGGAGASQLWSVLLDGVLGNLLYAGSYFDASYAPPFTAGFSGAVHLNVSLNNAGEFEGDITGVVNGGGRQLALESVAFVPGCGGPVGTIGVRDPNSAWWTVVLDEACTGCGTAWFAGEAVGEVCGAEAIQEHILERVNYYVDNPP